MVKYILASILTGLLFALMDGLINGNPYAAELLAPFQPIARETVNIPAGAIIDVIYGFIISGIFLVILPALPSESGIMKGLAYGIGMWFFRVVMMVFSEWMMFNIPVKTLIYLLVTGFFETILLGILNGLILKKNA